MQHLKDCQRLPCADRRHKKVARDIAAKSPLAVWGTKRTLLRARDGGSGVADGLDRVALHNAAFLLGHDIREIVAARGEGRPPRFSKL
jgi:enoyl-CoA hydratase/carnithine racemase